MPGTPLACASGASDNAKRNYCPGIVLIFKRGPRFGFEKLIFAKKHGVSLRDVKFPHISYLSSSVDFCQLFQPINGDTFFTSGISAVMRIFNYGHEHRLTRLNFFVPEDLGCPRCLRQHVENKILSAKLQIAFQLA